LKKNSQSIVFDIGSNSIKIAIGSSKDDHIFIKDYVIMPTPEDAIYNGKIYHKSKIAESIEQYVKKKNIKKLNVKVSISSGDLILRTFEIPKMEEKELKAAVKFEMENLLPEAIDNYVVDFTILEEYEEEIEDGEKMSMFKVQTAALPKAIVEAYLTTFEKAGLSLDIVDIQSNSIAKLFGGRKKLIKDFEDKETIDKNIAIIDLGNQKTTVTIMEYGKIFLNRVINKGGRDITSTIAEILDIDIVEAEKWKLTNNYLKVGNNEQLQTAIESNMEEMIVEINKVIDYFISRSIQKKLDRIYLIGGGAKTMDITKYFEDNLNVVTKLGNDYRNINVNIDETKFSEDLLYLCNVLGILLRKD
jgi:type IV pilus assembly protein PilM